MIITESKATKIKHKPNSEEEQRMNKEMEVMIEALRDAKNGYLRVKDEMRPLLREAVNKAQELEALTQEDCSMLRQEIRDGSKDELERIARGLRGDLKTAYVRMNTEEEESIPQPAEGAPEREEKPADTTPQPEPQKSGADTERVDAMEKKLDMIAEAILKGDQGAQPETSTKPDENGLITHWAVPRIFDMISTNKQVLLVGGAGTGKTTMGRQLNALLGHEDDRFYSISLSAGVSEAHLTGRMVIDGAFLDTQFLDIVENGGTILLDEFDNADPDVLVGLNSLLANSEISVPLRRGQESATRSENCHIICSANTWGNANSGGGSAGSFVRKELDSATLDRFTCSKWQLDVDRRIVNAMLGLPDDFTSYPEIDKLSNDEMLENKTKFTQTIYLRELFDYVNAHRRVDSKQLNRDCTPRFIGQAVKLVNAGWRPEEVLKVYLQDWTDDELHSIGAQRNTEFAKYGLTTIEIDESEFMSVEVA